MTIEHTTHHVGHGFFHVRSGNEDRKDRSNVTLTLRAGACPFGNFRYRAHGGRRESIEGRGLASRE